MSAEYKLYLNFEGHNGFPEFTCIYRSSGHCEHTVRNLLDDFCSKYSLRNGKDIPIEVLEVVTEKGKRCDVNTQIVKAFSSGSDVQVTTSADLQVTPFDAESALKTTVHPGTRLEQVAANLQLNTSGQLLSTGHSAAESRSHINDGNVDLDTTDLHSKDLDSNKKDGKVYLPIIKQFLERAKEAESKKYFRAACKIYEQVASAFNAATRLALTVNILFTMGAAVN